MCLFAALSPEGIHLWSLQKPENHLPVRGENYVPVPQLPRGLPQAVHRRPQMPQVPQETPPSRLCWAQRQTSAGLRRSLVAPLSQAPLASGRPRDVIFLGQQSSSWRHSPGSAVALVTSFPCSAVISPRHTPWSAVILVTSFSLVSGRPRDVICFGQRSSPGPRLPLLWGHLFWSTIVAMTSSSRVNGRPLSFFEGRFRCTSRHRPCS